MGSRLSCRHTYPLRTTRAIPLGASVNACPRKQNDPRPHPERLTEPRIYPHVTKDNGLDAPCKRCDQAVSSPTFYASRPANHSASGERSQMIRSCLAPLPVTGQTSPTRPPGGPRTPPPGPVYAPSHIRRPFRTDALGLGGSGQTSARGLGFTSIRDRIAALPFLS